MLSTSHPNNEWQRLYPSLDHIKQSKSSESLNPNYLHSIDKQSSAVITPDNRGLAYGDGFFTTMGVLDGKILWQDYHLQRLLSHAQALQLHIDSASLLISLQAQAQRLSQGVMKLIVIRAVQALRGYGFMPSSLDERCKGSACEIWLKSIVTPINTSQQAHLPNGQTVFMQPAIKAICLTSQLACLPPSLAGLKTLNRLDSVLASGELQAINAAQAANWGEGLVRDMMGSWVEGTMSNVFYQLSPSAAGKLQAPASLVSCEPLASNYLLSGQWFTPPLTQSGVNGVLRQVLIDGFAKTDSPIIIRPLQDEDLTTISQMFFCNALRGIMPVTYLQSA